MKRARSSESHARFVADAAGIVNGTSRTPTPIWTQEKMTALPQGNGLPSGAQTLVLALTGLFSRGGPPRGRPDRA
jgi:hypothetical protein